MNALPGEFAINTCGYSQDESGQNQQIKSPSKSCYDAVAKAYKELNIENAPAYPYKNLTEKLRDMTPDERKQAAEARKNEKTTAAVSSLKASLANKKAIQAARGSKGN